MSPSTAGQPRGKAAAADLAWRPCGKNKSNAERHEAAAAGDFVAELRLWKRAGEWQGVADVFAATDRSLPASLGAVAVEGGMAAARTAAAALLAKTERAWRRLGGPAIVRRKHGGDMSLSRERRRQKHLAEAWDAAGRCHACGGEMRPKHAGSKCDPCRDERQQAKERSRRLIEQIKKAGRPYPWESLPRRGALNPKTGKPYRNSQQGRWLQAYFRRLRTEQGNGRPAKAAGKRVFEEHLAAEKRQLDAKLDELRARLAAELPTPPWDAEPDINPHTGKPYKSNKRSRWIAMRFSYPSERRAAVAKETQGRPEVRRKIGAKAKARWSDPAYKKRVGAQISRAHNSPAGQLALAGRARAYLDTEDGFITVVANRSRAGAWHRIGATRDSPRQLYNLRRKGAPGFAAPGDELELVAKIPCRLFHRAAARLHELLGMDAAHKARHGIAVEAPLATIQKAARRAIVQVDGKAGR